MNTRPFGLASTGGLHGNATPPKPQRSRLTGTNEWQILFEHATTLIRDLTVDCVRAKTMEEKELLRGRIEGISQIIEAPERFVSEKAWEE